MEPINLSEIRKIKIEILEKIKSFKEQCEKERESRISLGNTNIPFGIKYLDEAAGGIYKNDLILLGAKTGVGKTEMATHIAAKAAEFGKHVCYFALEAERQEIERRIKYKLVAKIFFDIIKKEYAIKSHIDYMSWYYFQVDHITGRYEEEIDNLLIEQYKTLYTFYREHGDYTIDDFEKQLMAIKNDFDLIVIDHFHYFDFDDDNENRAQKRIAKKCRDLSLISEKPIILVAHLRKSQNNKHNPLIPTIDDFHGSSDLAKIATKIILMAPALGVETGTKTQLATYIHLAKNRVGGNRSRYPGICTYNLSGNSYDDNYYLADIYDPELKPIDDLREMPQWATHGRIYGA